MPSSEHGGEKKELENLYESFKRFLIFHSPMTDNIELDCKGYRVAVLIKCSTLPDLFTNIKAWCARGWNLR